MNCVILFFIVRHMSFRTIYLVYLGPFNLWKTLRTPRANGQEERVTNFLFKIVRKFCLVFFPNPLSFILTVSSLFLITKSIPNQIRSLQYLKLKIIHWAYWFWQNVEKYFRNITFKESIFSCVLDTLPFSANVKFKMACCEVS